MDDKKEILSLNQDDYEVFSNEINNLHWRDFENLVIDIFKNVFETAQIEIIHTNYSHDGGRDGEGTFNIMPYGKDTNFEIRFKIWIEVKKRTAKVSGNDIGLHALTAFLNKVSFLIFVSNSSFEPQVKKALTLLSGSHNINHDLIEGEQLFKLYQKHSLICTKDNKTKELCLHKNDKINISLSYSKRPLKRYSTKSITVEAGEPFYIFVDFDFQNCTIDSINEYKLSNDDIEFIPYDNSPLINAQKLNCRMTHTWVACATGEILKPIIKIYISNKDERPVELPLIINVQKPLFTFKYPASVSSQRDILNNLLTNWFDSGTYKAAIVYGNAGTGKSYLVNQYRHLWLQRHVLEIILDGEIENSESVLLNRFIQDVFPIPIGLLGEDQENSVYDFFVDCQLSSKSARKLANAICYQKKIDAQEFSSDILSDLLYFLIRRKSEQGKVIIIYEDIHKCQPSVVQLLIKTYRRLIYEKVANIFILLCSRKSASFKDQEALREWLSYVEEILEDQNIQPIILEPYSIDEATSLIQNTIFSISEIDTLNILEQVGTTPFGLKEALLYMYQKEWLEYDSEINQFILTENSFTGLRAAIVSNIFTQVTKSRISDIKLRIPQWAAVFMDMGACLGTSFSRKVCFEALNRTIDEAEIDDFFALANKLGILKNSNLYFEYIKFEHDLIRTSLLNDMDEINFRILSSKLLKVISDDFVNVKQKAFLAFQAGIPDAVEFYSECYGDKSVELEIYEDALEAYKMTFYVTDKNMITGTRITNTSLWFMDEGLNKAKENQIVLDLPINIRNKKNMSLCKKIVDTASNIGSGSQDIVECFITEGLMLAKVLNDLTYLGIFHIRQGICFFDKKDLDKSINEFRKALNYLSITDFYNRGHALVELAISLRHAGKKNESFVILKQALKEVGHKSPEIKLRIFANAGSLYFNTDWKRTRKYWQKALEVAKEWGNAQYWVHMLIDIGHLNLLDNCFEKADDCYRLSYEKAHMSGLKKQEFKIHLHQSILVLIKNKEDIELQLLCSETSLKQAEQLGIAYAIDRRLWRVYANWANVSELKAKFLPNKSLESQKQLWHLAYTYDKKVIKNFETLIHRQNNLELLNNRRITPSLINIYLRSLNPTYPKQQIFENMDEQVMIQIKSIGDLIIKNDIDKVPQNIAKFLKPLFGIYRFIFT